MQLIVDTDTDISVQTKMSTIRQESLNEKFIDTSLIPNVCNDVSDITNKNDERIKKHEIAAKECDESVESPDQIAQHIETSQETVINNESQEFDLCDKQSVERKEYVKTENNQNIQIEHQNEVQVQKSDETATNAPVEEENVITVSKKEYTKTEKSQNLQIEHKNEVEDRENNEIALDALVEEENVIKVNKKEYGKTENTQNLQIKHKNEVQDKKNNEITLDAPVEEENVIKVNNKQINYSEIHTKTEQKSAQDCEFDKNELKKRVLEDEVKSEKQNNEKTQNDKIETGNDMINSMIESKIEDQSNINIENNVKDVVVLTNETVDKIKKQNNENFDMDISNEEQDTVDSSITSDIAHEIKHQISDTDMKPVEVIHEIKHKSETQSELIEMDTKIEEHDDVPSRVKEDNIKEVTKDDNATEVMKEDQVKVTNTKEEEIRQRKEESNEMDITIEKQDNININVIADKIETQVEETHEIEDNCEKQNVENMELDVIIEQDVIDGGVAHKDAEHVEVAHKVEGKSEKQSEESIGMDITNDEKDKVTTNNDIVEKFKLDNAIEDQVKINKGKEDTTKEINKGCSEMDVTFEEQDKFSTNVTDDKIEKGDGENSENKVQVQQQNQVITIVTKEERPTNNISVLGKGKDEREEPGYLSNSAIEDKLKQQSKDNNETKVKLVKLFNENNEIQDKLEEQQNEISAIINKLEEKGQDESQYKDNFIEQGQNNYKSEDKQSVTQDITAILDHGSTDNCKTSPCMLPEKEMDENKLEKTITISSLGLAAKNNQSEVISQEVEKHENESKRRSEDSENETKVEAENTFQKLEMQNSNEEIRLNTVENNVESAVTQMDIDEVIDIPDEKDDEDEKEPKNTVTMDTSVEKAESALRNDLQASSSNASDEVDLVAHEKFDPESFINETNIEHDNLKKPVMEIVEEKKKLTHISKLSNTLDILSDEEEDLPKEVPQKEIAASDKEFTSINIDDDDDIMLIDEESSTKDDKNKTESTPEPINEATVREDSAVEAKEIKDPLSEISGNNEGTIQSEVATPIITEPKVSEPKPDLMAQEEPTTPKKPLLKLDFLKTCKKNLADMTRDELEEFCILKIVESVVDRSNLSEIKSQFKALAQNIEEYKKKASVLTKQNRDLQVVLKSVQEEQKKKSNMPITPLKITRSVGMQVLMTDKVSTRKKVQNPNTSKSNAGTNSGPNRQGKAAPNNVRLQKMITNTNNNSPIPVPRLVPAINSSNLNNMKLQQSPVNASGKSQVTNPVIKSPIQSVSNGLPAASPVQKPEKRPHSRMQQNESVTVDLTDDEPPAKVISRNATPPVRLVPPQNLLAPNRQPFGQNVSSPRKVYIPISGSQTPVGVRPGQTIMLRTISPQGPRQRAPTPGLAKPSQSSNAVRMQRVPSRHPAPLPESVKQYQPQNWKALPPAPELKLSKVENGIVISWKIDGYQEENYEEIASYQLYAYQETTSPPSTALWKKIGDVKALALPMACTLTQFMAGYKYYFAVRAVDIRSRLGPFSLPGSILLLNKM